MGTGRRNGRSLRSTAGLAILGVTLAALALPASMSAQSEAPSTAPAGDTAAGPTLERAKQEGILRVGFANEAPFAYSSADGKLTGFVTDAVREIGTGIGIPNLEGVLTEFAGLIPGLQADRFDAVGAGLYIRKARCEQATPSDPVYQVQEGLAVKQGNPKNLHSYQDLAQPGMKAGTVSGSVNVEYFKDAGVPEDQIVLFPDVPTAIAGLQAGRVDAVSMSAISLLLQIKQLDAQDVELVGDFAGPTDAQGNPVTDYGAVYFRSEDTDLIAAFNAKLAEIRDNGRLLELFAPYGLTEAAIPPADATAEVICQTAE